MMKADSRNTMSLLTAAWVLFFAAPSVADTYTDICGVTWTYTVADGLATIISASLSDSKIDIPETLGGATLAEIPADCFAQAENLIRVTIPGSVTNIGAYAFAGCSNLEEVVFSDGLKTISSGAFAGCTALKKVSLPSTLERLGDTVARDVSSYGRYANSYGEYADYARRIIEDREDISQLEGIQYEREERDGGLYMSFYTPFDECVGIEGICYFYGCVNKSSSISTNGAASAITVSAHNSIYASAGYDSMGRGVFEGCVALDEVSLNDGLLEIGAATFKGCAALKRLEIPETVESIGGFSERVMEDVTVSFNDNSQIGDDFDWISKSAYTNETRNEEQELSGFAEGCTNLTAVTLPPSLKYLGPRSFALCSSLKEIELPDTLAWLAEGMFADCANLETVVLPASLELIGCKEEMPHCNESHSQSSYESIAYGAEEPSITSTFQQVVTHDEYDADGTRHLRREEILSCNNGSPSIHFEADTIPAKVAENRWRANAGDDIVFPLSVDLAVASDYIGELLAFAAAKRTSDKAVAFDARRRFYPSEPSGVEGVFAGCKSLKTIALPDTVRRIADYAFAGCESLESINVPPGLLFVGHKAFDGCASLPDISAPWQGHTNILDDLMSDEDALREIGEVFSAIAEDMMRIGSDLTDGEWRYVLFAIVDSANYVLDNIDMARLKSFCGLGDMHAALAGILHNASPKEDNAGLLSCIVDRANLFYGDLAWKMIGRDLELESFEGVGDLLYGVSDIAQYCQLTESMKAAFANTLTSSVRSFMEQVSIAVHDASRLQSFEGLGDMYCGLAYFLGNVGSGISDAEKTWICEDAVHGVTTALEAISAGAMNTQSLEFFAGLGEVLTGLSDVLCTVGTGMPDSAKTEIADNIFAATTNALTSLTSGKWGLPALDSVDGLGDVLVGFSDVLATIGSLTEVQKSSIAQGATIAATNATLNVTGGTIEASVETLSGCGNILSGLADVLSMLNGSLNEELKQGIALSAMDCVSMACDNIVNAKFDTSQLQAFEGCGELFEGLAKVLSTVAFSLPDETKARYACSATDLATGLLVAVTNEGYPVPSFETFSGVADIYWGLGDVLYTLTPPLSSARKTELADIVYDAASTAMSAMLKSSVPLDGALGDLLFAMNECLDAMEAFPVLVPSVSGDNTATVEETADGAFSIKTAVSHVVVTIPDGVDAAKVTVEVTPSAVSVTPNGAAVRVVSGGFDITECLNIPPAVDGVISIAGATVKEEIIREALDVSKGAQMELSPAAPSLTTAATRPGLIYTLLEGATLKDMKPGDSTVGDGNPWTPNMTVKGGASAFYSISVDK